MVWLVSGTAGCTGSCLTTAVLSAGVVFVGSTAGFFLIAGTSVDIGSPAGSEVGSALGSRFTLGAGAGTDGSAGSASLEPAEGGVVSFLPLVPLSSLALALLSDVPVAISV